MKLDFKVNSQKMFAVMVYWIWAQTILVTYIRAVVMRLPYLGAFPDAVMMTMLLIILVTAIPSMQLTKQNLFFVITCVIIYLLNWCFFCAQREIIEEKSTYFLFEVLPLYMVGASLGRNRDREHIIRMLYRISMITIPTTMVYRALFASPMSEVASLYEGNMVYAYDLLPHLCLIAFHAVRKTNIWNVCFSVLGGVYLMLQGTRGAVVLYLTLIAVLFIMGRKSHGAVTRTIVVFGGAITFYLSPLYSAFIMFMYQEAQTLGLSVRIFEKILSGSAGQSSGRDFIREALMKAIWENPILGYGILSDRVIAGNYAHNIAIELWVEFGLIFGSILLSTLFYILVKGYRCANTEDEKGLIIALICARFGQLFLSGSYLDSPLLFFLLGLCATSMHIISTKYIDPIRRNNANCTD